MGKTINDYFSINLNEYSRIGISLEINKLLLAVTIVFILLIVALHIYRSSTRSVVFALMRQNALTEDEAKTLTELRLDGFFIKYLLSGQNLLTKVVKRQGAPEYTYEEYMASLKNKKIKHKKEKIDFASARFYISSDMKDRAEHIIDKYDTTVLKTALFCVLVAIIYICVAVCMPGILNLVNELLKTKNVIGSV